MYRFNKNNSNYNYIKNYYSKKRLFKINFKGTVLLSTHDHEFAQTVANRIIEITPKGAIDKYSTFDEYINDPKTKELRAKMYS